MCLVALVSSGYGQSHTFFNYSIKEGLPSKEVYSVYQDTKGFIWFATDAGVVKFDGAEMTTYNTKDGLTDPVVFEFVEDYKNRLWFRTYSGKLSYYENGKIIPYKYNNKLTELTSTDIIPAIHIDVNDNLWFCTGHISGRIDSLGIEKITIPELNNLFYHSIGDRYIIAASGKSQYINHIIINDHRFQVHLSDTVHQHKVYCAITWNHNIYITINNDIFEHRGDTLKKVFTSSKPIISLSTDKENFLWVGYASDGAARYKNGDFSVAERLPFLENRSVTKVLQDTEGGFWFSTLEKGIYYTPNLAINNYPLQSNIKLSCITSKPNYVLIGTISGEIIRYSSKTKSIIQKISFGSPIRDIMVSKGNNIWISNSISPYLLDSMLNIKIKFNNRHMAGGKFYEDRDGNIWSLGVQRISKYDSKGDTLLQVYNTPVNRSIFIKDTLVYITGRLGVQVWNKEIQLIATPKVLSNFKISVIESLDDHTIFFGTRGNGFILHNQHTGVYTYFNSNKNFIADNIYSVIRKDSLLWLSTENGLVIVKIHSLLNGKPEFDCITHKSGLLDDEMNFMAMTQNSLWLFTNEGFSTIPTNISKKIPQPRFYLKKLAVNNVSFDKYKSNRFKYNENNIEISYGFIAFKNQNIRTRYRLKKDANWVTSPNKKILFNSLAPDEYYFQLDYSVDNVRWRNAYSYAFAIKPPWWETWYFYFTVLALLALLGYVYFKNRLAQFREKNYLMKVINEHQQKLIQSEIETMERERMRIAKELHDGVGTNLTAIKLRIGQLLKKHNEPVAPDVEDQLQLTIKEIKDIIYGLTPSGLERYGLFASLKDYTEKLNTTIDTKINLNTFGKEINKPELNLLIFRVVQELISNSIKHSAAKHITIHINGFEDLFSIVYEDDGKGFSYDSIKNGLGLNNIDSRIQSVNGKLTFESGDFGISYTIDIPIN